MTISNGDYYIKYGLEKDPFPSGIVDKNIFLTPEINRRLKYAKQHIIENQKLLLITSMSGAGKTLLAQKLIVLKEADWNPSLTIAREAMDAEFLSYSIIKQLLPGQEIDFEQAVSMLHKYLEISYRESIRPVIVIDDADKLPPATLQYLLQLADLRYNDTLFRIVLFANESINETLSKVGLKELAEGTVDNISMPGFTVEQIPAYLKYRFSFCGADAEHPFTNSDIEYLYTASGGLPGGVNMLGRQIMQDALIKVKPETNYGIISVLLAFFLLALAGYLYYEDYNSQGEQIVSRDQNIILTEDLQDKENVLLNDEEITQNELSVMDESLSLKLSEFLTLQTVEEIRP